MEYPKVIKVKDEEEIFLSLSVSEVLWANLIYKPYKNGGYVFKYKGGLDGKRVGKKKLLQYVKMAKTLEQLSDN